MVFPEIEVYKTLTMYNDLIGLLSCGLFSNTDLKLNNVAAMVFMKTIYYLKHVYSDLVQVKVNIFK